MFPLENEYKSLLPRNAHGTYKAACIIFINEDYVYIYADDTTVHASNKDSKIVESKLQAASTDFKTNCIQKKMYVHVGKTSFMLIGTRQNLSLVESIQIYIDNEIIKEVENQKNFLELWLTNIWAGINKSISFHWTSRVELLC